MEAPKPPPKDLPVLENGIDPSRAREAINGGIANAMTENEVKNYLRCSAFEVLYHERRSPVLEDLVKDGASNVLFFICATYGLPAPAAEQQFHFPEPDDARTLPLCHWESLYVALIAELRQLHARLEEKWETKFKGGHRVLHMYGDGDTKESKPFTALEFAALVARTWRSFMDPRLLGRLENEVRLEKAANSYRIRYDDTPFRTHSQLEWQGLDADTSNEMLNRVKSMMNPHTHSNDEINEILWKDHAPLVRRACREFFGKDLDLAARRAELLGIDKSNPEQATSDAASCSCDDGCQCKAHCAYLPEMSHDPRMGCPCKKAAASQINMNIDTHEQEYDYPRMQVPSQPGSSRGHDHLYGVPTQGMARMHVAASATGDGPYPQHAGQQMTQVRTVGDAPMFQNRRGRSHTETGGLAYVPEAPPKTPRRRVKDSFPLNLYESHSGQRYPDFPDATREEQRPLPSLPPPVYGSSYYTTDMPARKQVPSTSTTSTTSPSYDPVLSSSPEHESPFISSSPEPAPEPGRSSKTKFPFFSRFKGKAAATDDFQVPGAGYPGQPQDDSGILDTSNVETPRITPLGTERRAAPIFGRHSAESPPRPTRNPGAMTRSNTADTTQLPPPQVPSRPLVPPMMKRSKTTDVSDLPLPDFINPKPATKQRYVSAGGNAKLSEREEIKDFVLPPAVDPGMSISRDDFLASLPPPRSSGDSVPRTSKEEEEAMYPDNRGEKRDRTESNTSSKRGVVKRMFSRTPSGSQ